VCVYIYIFLIIVSHILRTFIASVAIVHASDPQVNVGCIRVSYSVNLVFQDSSLDLKSLLS